LLAVENGLNNNKAGLIFYLHLALDTKIEDQRDPSQFFQLCRGQNFNFMIDLSYIPEKIPTKILHEYKWRIYS